MKHLLILGALLGMWAPLGAMEQVGANGAFKSFEKFEYHQVLATLQEHGLEIDIFPNGGYRIGYTDEKGESPFHMSSSGPRKNLITESLFAFDIFTVKEFIKTQDPDLLLCLEYVLKKKERIWRSRYEEFINLAMNNDSTKKLRTMLEKFESKVVEDPEKEAWMGSFN